MDSIHDYLLDAAPLGVYAVDADFRICKLNRPAQEVFGQQVIGRDFDEVIHLLWPREYADELVAIFRHTLVSGESYYAHERNEERLDRGGEVESYEWEVHRVPAGDGRMAVACYFRDISRFVQARTAQFEAANRRLAATNRQLAEYSSAVSNDLRVAEAGDRIKSMFLATMSHELRTPLNCIIGFTNIVLDQMAGPLNAEQIKQLGMVRVSANHLLELINDVLDISKMEAGKLEIHAEPVDVPATTARVVDAVALLAAQKGLAVTATVSPALRSIVSDRRRLEQILLNLLGNSVKFTAAGAISLTVDVVDDFRPTGVAPCAGVRFRVTDTGVGIKAEDMASLFEPFKQIHGNVAGVSDGTGLGLTISRRLARLLAGEISATSEWGRGSTFTLILPLLQSSAGPGSPLTVGLPH